MTELYYPLTLNSDGYPLDPRQQTVILQALLNDQQPVSDLWVLAYGWNNDTTSGAAHYRATIEAMQAVIPQVTTDPTYHPLFIGVHWPSKAWAGEVAMEQRRETAREVEGGAEGVFERGRAYRPATQEARDSAERSREEFLASYRSIFDPEAVYGDSFTHDFERLYALMYSSEPADQSVVREFVGILRKYRTLDPHSDSVETRNISTTPLDRLTARLEAELAADVGGHERFGLLDGLLDVFRTFTFWEMKARAAVVGMTGLYPVLMTIRQTLRVHNRQVRINLLGHSFGAKLLTAAITPAAGDVRLGGPFVDTLVLLQAAFSQFAFSSNIPVESGAVGYYAPMLERRLVANPLVVIYSEHDTANRLFYPAGMRLAAPFGTQIYERAALNDSLERYQISYDQYGALGANGAQGLPEERHRAMDMIGLQERYFWGNLSDVACVSVDGAAYINTGGFPAGAHSDILAPEIYYLALSMSLR